MPTGIEVGKSVGGGSAVRSGTGAELLAQALIAAGVRHLFGVPGDTGVAFYDALYDHTADIQHVLARDERHAAFMADAYARVSQRLGVLWVSSGGGVTYAVGGLGEAYAASVPVLVIASDIHRGSRGTGALTEIDQVRLFAAVTKQAIVAERADGIPADVARAVRLAAAGRPGPVALIVPEDVLDEQGSGPVTAGPGGPLLPAVPQPADAAAVERAAALGQILDRLPEVAGVAGRRARLAALRERQRGTAPPPGALPPGAGLPPGTLLADDVIDALDSVLAAYAAVAGLGREPIVLADPGTPTPTVASRWPVRHPGRSFLVPRGHGPMGYAIPAAVGAAMAAPGRPVIALTADGSFAMSCGELETIARLGLPVTVVQFTNHSLGWIKMLQHLYHAGHYFGVDPGPIDAVGVARACGLRAHRPDSAKALRDHLSAALEDGNPLYLDIDVPHMIDVVPQVPAWHRALRGDRARPVY